MERGAWWATVCVVMRVRHDLVTKPPPEPEHEYVSKVLSLFLYSHISANQLNGDVLTPEGTALSDAPIPFGQAVKIKTRSRRST